MDTTAAQPPVIPVPRGVADKSQMGISGRSKPAATNSTVVSAVDPAIADYLRDAAHERRVQMRQLAFWFALCATASVGLSTFMTDIGHFLGFIGLAFVFLVGGGVIWWSGRR